MSAINRCQFCGHDREMAVLPPRHAVKTLSNSVGPTKGQGIPDAVVEHAALSHGAEGNRLTPPLGSGTTQIRRGRWV